MLQTALLREWVMGNAIYTYTLDFSYCRNIDALVNWKPLVKDRLIARLKSIPWHASCSLCLSDSSTLLTGSAIFIHKNLLNGQIICSKVTHWFQKLEKKTKTKKHDFKWKITSLIFILKKSQFRFFKKKFFSQY